jgi:hypothetical protein
VLENNREIKCKKDGIYTESVKHRFSRIKQYMLIREFKFTLNRRKMKRSRIVKRAEEAISETRYV